MKILVLDEVKLTRTFVLAVLCSLLVIIVGGQTTVFAKSKAKELKEQGDFLYYHGDVDEAIEKFEQALTVEPDMVEAHMSLVNLYLMRKVQDKAIYHAKQVARIDSDSAQAHILVANLLRNTNKKEAIKEYEKAVAIGVKDTAIRTNLGYLYLEQNQISKALDCFEIVKQSKKASLNAFIGAAVAKYRLGKRIEAISDIDSLIREHGKVSSFLSTKGHLLLGMGKTKEAIKAYEESILSNPSDAKLMVKLADLYYKEGKKSKAEQLFKRSLKADPANVEAHYSLGIINQKRNDLKTASNYFEKGARLDKNSKVSRKMLIHSRRLKQKAGIALGSLTELTPLKLPENYPKSGVFEYSYSSLVNTPERKWQEAQRVIDNAKNLNLSKDKNKIKIDLNKPHMVPGRMH